MEKSKRCPLCIKKKVKIFLRIIDQYHYYLSVENFFEKCIYNTLYSYLESNDILSKYQSGFRKGDSCISQLLAITHEIYSNFDAYPSLETRGIFLDISKAFDSVA